MLTTRPLPGPLTAGNFQWKENTFSISGVSKDVASKVLGTQWTLKVWKHEDIWGCYLRCHELPHLNLWQGFALGDEKEVELPILGGMVKVKLSLAAS